MIKTDTYEQAEFTVRGHVQGVGFRWYVHQKAILLGLKGYTRNLYDGDVFVSVEGEKVKIDRLYEFLLIGPSRSSVNSVKAVRKNYAGIYTGFEIK